MQPQWNGQIKLSVDKTLRYVYFMDKTHPMSNSQGKVYYHRHVAALSLGRWLNEDEDVHHVDEDRQNNDPSNLEVLTRPEHARRHNATAPARECSACGTGFKATQNIRFCSPPCSHKARRLFDPTKVELARMVWAMPASDVAKHFGVSNSAVQKRCKRLGVEKPGRGYWSKKRKNKPPA